MHDETPFNVCLWKRNATENLGFAFLNTHLFDSVKLTEESNIKEQNLNGSIDDLGNDWEYIYNSEQIIAYHGVKNLDSIEEILKYLLNK